MSKIHKACIFDMLNVHDVNISQIVEIKLIHEALLCALIKEKSKGCGLNLNLNTVGV